MKPLDNYLNKANGTSLQSKLTQVAAKYKRNSKIHALCLYVCFWQTNQQALTVVHFDEVVTHGHQKSFTFQHVYVPQTQRQSERYLFQQKPPSQR